MRKMKKIVSLVLALVLALAMSATTFATEPSKNTETVQSGKNDNSGAITINDAIEGQTYTIYQILKLESYDVAKNAYSYKATDAWSVFINSAEVKDVYVTVDAQGYVEWITGADAAAFAKLALTHAPAANQGQVTASSATVEFENLNLGYYLIDTTLGTLCSLDTTNTSVEMYEKNEVPSVKKEVQEDFTEEWGSSNTAQIGDTVNFKTTVSAKPGADKYVLHDMMTDGLTLNEDSIAIAGLTKGTDYTVAFNVEHKKADGTKDYDCDFEITFTQAYLDTITEAKDLVVTYSAVLNDEAVISADTNRNKTRLDYGDGSSTEWAETTTVTLKFDIVKTNDKNEVLEGAQFELYDAETEGNRIALAKDADGTYRVATADEIAAAGFESAIIDAGTAVVKGLDANTTYYLQETNAPDGYNKLAERVEVAMGAANLTAELNGTTWVDGGVHVINYTGTELPSTGGMGTTIFYVAGGLLVLLAVVLLFVKRRNRCEA